MRPAFLLSAPPAVQVMPAQAALRVPTDSAQRPVEETPHMPHQDTRGGRDALQSTALPPRLRQGFVYENSADGLDENVLVLFHGHGCANP